MPCRTPSCPRTLPKRSTRATQEFNKTSYRFTPARASALSKARNQNRRKTIAKELIALEKGPVPSAATVAESERVINDIVSQNGVKFCLSLKEFRKKSVIIQDKLNEIKSEILAALNALKDSIPGWSTLWERHAHDAEHGHSGTPDTASLVMLLSVLKYLVIQVCGLPESAFAVLECGCGVLCLQKAIHIALPRMHVFGFEYKNYFDSVFADLSALSNAVRNLKAKVSSYSGVLLNDMGTFQYNFGTGFESSPTIRQFLQDLGASKQVSKSKNLTAIAFWEGWSVDNKAALLQCLGKSPTVTIVFTADRPNLFRTEKKLSNLNSGRRLWLNNFLLFETIPCILAGGKSREVLTGSFFVRRRIFVAKYQTVEVIRAPSPPPANLNNCRWMPLWERSDSICLNIALEAVVYRMVISGSWIYSGKPTRWHIMDYTNTMDNKDLGKFVFDSIKIYVSSNYYVSGGYKSLQKTLRSTVQNLSRAEQVKRAETIAKLQMMPVSPSSISNEVNKLISMAALLHENKGAMDSLFKKRLQRFCCTIQDCDFIGEREEILVHALSTECPGTDEDIALAVESVDDLQFRVDAVPHLKKIFSGFKDSISGKDQMDFVGDLAKRQIEKKLTEILTDELNTYNIKNRKKELLNRWRAQVSVRQQNILNRSKRKLKTCRFVNDSLHVTSGDQVYKIKLSHLSTKHDAETAQEMLLDSGFLEFLSQDKTLGVDNAFVKNVEGIVRARIRMVLGHEFRKKRWRQSDALYISVHLDGAPRTQRGQQKDQLVIVIRILNENLTLERKMLIPLVIANMKEGSHGAMTICKIVGKAMVEFQKNVRENGLPETGHRDVKFVAASDLKALNALFGFAEYNFMFPYPSKIYSSKENSGWGMFSGRNSSTPFKSYKAREMGVDEFKIEFGANQSRTMELLEEAKRNRSKRKRGRQKTKTKVTIALEEKFLPQPVKMTAPILSFLRGEVDLIPEEDRRSWAKTAGVGLIDPCPLLGDLEWYAIALCALHYKTTKVLDILNMCTHVLASYDEAWGHSIADKNDLGDALKHFLAELSGNPKFKGKLIVYAEKTELLFLKTAGEASFAAMSSVSSKKLESFLPSDTAFSRRLIGEQANSLLIDCEELLATLKRSRAVYLGGRSAKVEKGLLATFSAIYNIASYSRDIVYLMSLASHEDNESEAHRTIRLGKIAKRYRHTAAKLEFLQCFAFPEWFRPYDLTITCCGPDVMDALGKDGLLLGEVGLLEVVEAYHQYVKQLPVMKFYEENHGQQSACMAKLQKILLITIYGEACIDPLPLTEVREPYVHHKSGKLTKTIKDSYIKILHEFDGLGCICGRAVSCSDCEHCSYELCGAFDDLVNDCANHLESQCFTESDIKRVHKERKKLTKDISTKGLNVCKKRK